MFKRKISLILVATVLSQSLSLTVFAGALSINSTSDNIDVIETKNDAFQIKNISVSNGSHAVSEFMGNFQYNYPIVISPGRNNLTPSLNLNYSNAQHDTNSIVGFGWNLGLTKIERYAETGAVEDLYTDNTFISDFAGGNGKLNSSNGVTLYGEYTPRVLNSKIKHEFLVDNTWQVTDATGTVYLLGADSSARIESEDGTLRQAWFLSSVTDTNGNQIEYEYVKSQGYPYLKRILYGNETQPFEIRFEPYYSGTIEEFDVLPSYARQFPVVEKKELLDSIEIYDPFSENRLVYEFTYETTDGVSFLTQIQKQGIDSDGTVTTENPTTFDYEAYLGERSFTPTLPEDASIFEKMWISQENKYTVNALYVDYNGDGWIDILNNYTDLNSDDWTTTEHYDEVYINQKNGTWTEVDLSEDEEDSLPSTISRYYDHDDYFSYTAVLDLDGNGKQEFVPGKTWYDQLYYDYIPVINKFELSDTERYYGSFGDVNGDGLLDIFRFGTSSYNFDFDDVAKNIGSDWQLENLTFPASFNNKKETFLEHGSILIQDLNADGLDDILVLELDVDREDYCDSGNINVYTQYLLLNGGNNNFIDVSDEINFPELGFKSYKFYSSYYTCNTGTLKYEEVYPNNIRFFDFNRDGLIDIYNGDYWQYNNGNGFGEYTRYAYRDDFYGDPDHFGGGETLDLNFDGILEQIIYISTTDGDNSYRRRIRENVYPDLPILTQITEPLGKAVSVEYTPASGYLDEADNQLNPDLPLAHLTVSQITEDDGLGNTGTTKYTYSGGKLYHPEIVRGNQEREFLGFATVEKTLPDDSKLVSEYLQGDEATNFAEKGLLKNSKFYQDEDETVLLQETENFYETYERSIDGFQAQLVKQFQTIYAAENQTESGSTATQFTYNENGNLIQKIDWGKVVLNENETAGFTDADADKITTEIDYAINPANHIYSLVSQTESTDFNDNTIARQKTFYDQSAILGEVTNGNPTKSVVLQNLNPLEEISTETTYNAYGLPLTSTNARGYTTTITYDSYNLYPQTVTNAKGQSISYVYDYLLGKVEETTDPNGAKQKTIFDGLGRVLEEQVSNPKNPTELVTTVDYSYDYASVPMSIETMTYPGHDEIEVLSKTYLDGYGRTIQTTVETEGENKYLTTRTVYDSRGNVQKQLLPQVYTNTLFKSNITDEPSTNYTYDALRRPLTVTNSLGTATTTYLPFETQNTDTNGERKDYLYDARGNLIQVKEYLDDVAYTTNYIYDTSGNLTKIQDAELNEKSFSYDLLGLKLSEELLHTADDLSPAIYTYAYDANGNLTSLTDPLNQTGSYVYDELDRLLTESFDSQIQATYTYDQGNYGIGRIATITTPHIAKNYVYDVLGRVLTETETIEQIDYVTEFTYDLLGKIQTLIYPEGSQVAYTYNNANFLESVALGSGALVTNLDYAPTLAVSRIDYANGVYTTNTYAENQLYRLTNKFTKKTGEIAEMQNLSYTYDSVGNILQISDTSDLQTAKTANYVYDDLHRLTVAEITNTANNADYMRTYAYSLTGNLLDKSDLGVYSYTAKHPQAVSVAGGQNFTYDLKGNLLTDGNFTHTWDYKNRLLNSTASGATVDYVYDEGSNRIQKISSGSTVTYVSKYFETDGKIDTLHFFANDSKLASLEKVNPNFTETSSGAILIETASGSSSVDSGSVVTGTGCMPPFEGAWGVTGNCVLDGVVQSAGDIIVYSGAVLTVGSGAVLRVGVIDRVLLVRDGGSVVVEEGGEILQEATPVVAPEIIPELLYPNLIYHHTDHLTGSAVETDEEGNVVEVLDYYPYGDMRFDDSFESDSISENGALYENKYKFTGKELDDETDLYYYGARYYDAEVGRFVSVDPWFGDLSDPQSLNKYAYVRNNPLKYVDPSGESWLCPTAYAPESEANFEELKANESSMNGFDETFNAVPGTGDANDVVQALTGKNIQGEEISGFDRALSFITAIPVLTTGMIKMVGKADNVFDFTRRGWTVGTPGDSVANLTEHFGKHADDVGATSLDDYYNKANDFIDSGYTHKFQEGGDTVFYNVDNKKSAIINSDNQISTFYEVKNQNKIDGYQKRIDKENNE